MNQHYDWESSLYGYEPKKNYSPPKKTNPEHIRTLRRLGIYNGLALLSYIFTQSLLTVLLGAFGLLKNYNTDLVYQNAVDIILIILGLFLPYAIFGRKMAKESESSPLSPYQNNTLHLGKPENTINFILAVICGVGICMVANIINGYISGLINTMGYEATSPELSLPTSPEGILLTFLKISILAGFTEEICLRGYTMGSLRIFGDKTAIMFSSFVFALMHGNLVQSPFAMLAGLGLGYLSIKTGSIWTGIGIHILNNFISVFVSYSVDFLGEENANFIYSLLLIGLIFLGACALPLFLVRTKHHRLSKGYDGIGMMKKAALFFLNPPMLLAIGYMLYITSQYLEKVS